MQNILQTIWAWLDGNKTILCLALQAVLQKAIELQVIASSPTLELISWILLGLGGGALVDHIKKGYFTTEKGA